MSTRWEINLQNSNVIDNFYRWALKASTAWDFSPDLGIVGINLGFREFSKQSWDFYGSRKLKKNTCKL